MAGSRSCAPRRRPTRWSESLRPAPSLTARAGEAPSDTADLGRDVSALSVEERAETAVSQAAATGDPVPVPDGVHDVVFGGLATAELIGFLPDFGFTGPAVAGASVVTA